MIKINTAYQMKKPSEIDFQTMSNTTDSKFWELLGTTGGYPFTVIRVNSGILIGTVYMEIRNYYGRVSSFIIYEEDFNLLTEIEKPEDPTDLLCKAVYIRRPFANPVGGWVTDQWIEDGVELLNVVHAGEYSVVPRSAVINVRVS
ncbi:transcriptional regulator [Escherichia phage vB_EcoM-UFV05]|nr:transcriptional regulator [Escherichia phage vB_EcoM-UFV09]UYE92974.1 transcriptional regulator [Escherichia phage vB_EcoM-UFV05]UYL83867.1 transcriptional regulator [Escherichia phage vB_EcoM-UFV06]UYL84153.1 transcriptional regulator [Escherichia phage vB_EcoM-UFV10]UYL84439.1 transcriptional regulator [Escherichia phage vB_EcoM-UFV11]